MSMQPRAQQIWQSKKRNAKTHQLIKSKKKKTFWTNSSFRVRFPHARPPQAETKDTRCNWSNLLTSLQNSKYCTNWMINYKLTIIHCGVALEWVLLCKRVVSLKLRGSMYKGCMRSAICYSADCWGLRKHDDERKLKNYRKMRCYAWCAEKH